MGKGAALADVASHVLRHHFGGEPSRLHRLSGGNAATVFEARMGARDVIIKLYLDEERARWFRTVAAMVERVRGADVPAPRLVAHGIAGRECAFVIYDKVPGLCAAECSGDVRALWRQVGHHIARANGLPGPGYGRVRFGMADSPVFFSSWREFIEPEVERLTQPVTSERHPEFDGTFRRHVRERLLTLCDWEFEPRIIHGNVTGSNVIVDSGTGELSSIIDWDQMIFARSPHFELATALLWMDREAVDGFMEGYGLSTDQYAAIETEVQSVRLFYLTGYLLWHLLTKNEQMTVATREEMDRILSSNR